MVMEKVQVIMYAHNEEVKADIPIDLYQQVCNDFTDEESREELAWNFEHVIREHFPRLHQYLIEYLKLMEWYEQFPNAAHYALLSDWFDAKEIVYNVRFEQVYLNKDSSKWADEITVLGREIWHKFPSLQQLHEFIEGQNGCSCVVEVITADREFAGFAVAFYLHTRTTEGEIYEYEVKYICMTAIKQQFRRQGLGNRLLQHVTRDCCKPIVVTTNPFVGNSDNKQRMRTFYENNGYVCTPMGWTFGINDAHVFVKGKMHMEAWTAISERVQELWNDYEEELKWKRHTDS